MIKSGGPVEQDKQLQCASLVANTIMLSNVADLTIVLSKMAADAFLHLASIRLMLRTLCNPERTYRTASKKVIHRSDQGSQYMS